MIIAYKYDQEKQRPISYELTDGAPTDGYILEAPPQTGDRESVVPNQFGTGWDIVPDWRGVILYNTADPHATQTITEKNIVPGSGWTDIKPSDTGTDEWDGAAWVPSLVKLKAMKKIEIKIAFQGELRTGKFQSPSLGIDIDYRRSDVNNDLQNAITLLSCITRGGATEIEYVGYDKTMVITPKQLKALIEEMEEHGVYLYNKKHGLEKAIDNAADIAELEAIVWE